MKNLILILLSIAWFQTTAQKSLYKLIDQEYIPIINPENVYSVDPQKSSITIPLGFMLDEYLANEILVNGSTISFGSKDYKRYVISPFTTFNHSSDIGGIRIDEAQFSQILIRDNGAVVSTVIEAENLFFSNFPNDKFSFQLKVNRNGDVRFSYGNGIVNPSFPAFSDITFHWYIEREINMNTELLNGFSVVGGNDEPLVIDETDLSQYNESNIEGFSKFPDKNYVFEISNPSVTSSIAEMQANFELTYNNKNVLIRPQSNNYYKVKMLSIDGKLLKKTENLQGTNSIQTPESAAGYIILVIEDAFQAFSQKIKL